MNFIISKWAVITCAAILIAVTLSGTASAGGSNPPPPPPGVCDPAYDPHTTRPQDVDLAYRWAPFVIQDTAGSWKYDLITKFEFDGDFKGNNNWQNADKSPWKDNGLIPYLYFMVQETSTHWYIHYLKFHPRDWNNIFFGTCAPGSDCHENDSENILIMVRKDGSAYGQFEFMETRAHNNFYQYALPGSGVSNGTWSGAEDLDNDAQRGFSLFTDSSVGITTPRPAVYVESKGHGICDWYHNDNPLVCSHPDDKVGTSGNDGIYYYPSQSMPPSMPPNPTGGQYYNHKRSYRLISLLDALWPLRYCKGNGNTYDGNLDWNGITGLGHAFDGDDYAADAATMIWAQSDTGNLVQPGDLFFDPAFEVTSRLIFANPVSQIYTYNPALGIE